MRFILHVGLEKTGSTALQELLRKSRGSLSDAGVLFPRSLSPGGLGGHGLLPAAIAEVDPRKALGLGRDVAREVDAGLPELENAMRKEIAAGRYQTILLSSEHFYSLLGTEELVLRLWEFLRRLGDASIEVHAVVRRQDEVMMSRASTELKSGRWVSDPLNTSELSSHYLNYHEGLSNFASVFGVEQMQVKAYSGPAGASVVDRLVGSLDLPVPVGDSWTANRSLGREALEILKALVDEGLFNADDSLTLGLVTSALAERLPGRGFWEFVSRRRARQFVQEFALANAAIAEQFNGGTSFFDDDFSKFPSEVDAMRPLGDKHVAALLNVIDTLMKSSRRAVGVSAVRPLHLEFLTGSAVRIPVTSAIEHGLLELMFGWHVPEPWGVWSNSDTAELRVTIATSIPHELYIALEFASFGPKGDSVIVEQLEGGTWRSVGGSAQVGRVQVSDERTALLRITVPVLTSLAEENPFDQRMVGVAVSAIWFSTVPTERRREK